MSLREEIKRLRQFRMRQRAARMYGANYTGTVDVNPNLINDPSSVVGHNIEMPIISENYSPPKMTTLNNGWRVMSPDQKDIHEIVGALEGVSGGDELLYQNSPGTYQIDDNARPEFTKEIENIRAKWKSSGLHRGARERYSQIEEEMLADQYVKNNKASYVEADYGNPEAYSGRANPFTGQYRRGEELKLPDHIPENAEILAVGSNSRNSNLFAGGHKNKRVSLDDPEVVKKQLNSIYEAVRPGDLVAMRDAARAERAGDRNVPMFSAHNAAGRRYLGPNARTVASMPRDAVINGENPEDYL